MTDIYSKRKRSKIMSNISGVGTKPEIQVRRALFSQGFRFRKNDNRLPGKPDIVLPKYKTALFVNGCFWHGHHCSAGKLPATNVRFWKEKIRSNVMRDKKNLSLLRKNGWNIFVLWQCKLRGQKNREKLLNNLFDSLHRQ